MQIGMINSRGWLWAPEKHPPLKIFSKMSLEVVIAIDDLKEQKIK